MNPFDDKYFVFIISGGRTGTRYFGEVFSKLINNAYSVHEPDMLSARRGLKNIWNKLTTFGIYQLVLGKILGKTGIRNLSQKYISGRYDLEKLKQKIKNHRENYYNSIDKKLIIESYSGWYGCIPAIQDLYNNYKIIIITREPKNWVRSNINWGALFGRWDFVSKLGLGRLNPKMINDKKYINKWKHFSRFEKICWTYKTQYEIMLNNVNNDQNAKVIKFEDLFHSENKYNNLNNLLHFITNFQDEKFVYSYPKDILEKKIHKNVSDKFPDYYGWSNSQKIQYEKICSNVQKRLNY